jgi:hypothetical protein
MSSMVTHGNGGSRRQDLERGLVPEALPSPAGPHTRTPPLSSSTYSPAKSTRTVKTQVRRVISACCAEQTGFTHTCVIDL